MKPISHWFVLKFIAILVLGALVVMLLWNAIATDIFGLGDLNYWQALGLLVLSRVLVGGFHAGYPGHRLHAAWHDLSPSDRQNLLRGRKRGIRPNCGHNSDHDGSHNDHLHSGHDNHHDFHNGHYNGHHGGPRSDRHNANHPGRDHGSDTLAKADHEATNTLSVGTEVTGLTATGDQGSKP